MEHEEEQEKKWKAERQQPPLFSIPLGVCMLSINNKASEEFASPGVSKKKNPNRFGVDRKRTIKKKKASRAESEANASTQNVCRWVRRVARWLK